MGAYYLGYYITKITPTFLSKELFIRKDKSRAVWGITFADECYTFVKDCVKKTLLNFVKNGGHFAYCVVNNFVVKGLGGGVLANFVSTVDFFAHFEPP